MKSALIFTQAKFRIDAKIDQKLFVAGTIGHWTSFGYWHFDMHQIFIWTRFMIHL